MIAPSTLFYIITCIQITTSPLLLSPLAMGDIDASQFEGAQ
jgi:hypothetical protein